MADAADEIARNIARNVVPFKAGEDLAGAYQPAENVIMRLLQSLGFAGKQSQGYTPKLNEPLPRVNPVTGQIDYPQGYRGPR